MPTWDTEPKLLSKTDRANICKQIADLGLVLPSVMESLRIAGPNVNKPGNLERLRVAAEMAHELSPKTPDHDTWRERRDVRRAQVRNGR